MAADFISINRGVATATHFNEILSAINSVRNAKTQLEKVQALGFRMFDPKPDNGDDFALFEEKFGIPAGQGKLVFDLVNGSVMALNGEAQSGNAIELINRIG